MGEYKFDRFYYSVDKSNEHYLDEIEHLTEEEFNAKYKDKMYCPKCSGPKLTLVRNSGKYLRTYPNQPHALVDGEICLYQYKAATKKIMEKYVQELRNKKKIKSVLEATMRKLFKIDNYKYEPSEKVEMKSINPLLIEQVQSDKIIKKNVIPHYSFRNWGENIPQDRLVIGYGKVYIELKEINFVNKEGELNTSTFMHFKDITSKKLLTSCLRPKSMDVSEGNYYAVVLGKCCSKESKGITYYNIHVNYPFNESILLKPF